MKLSLLFIMLAFLQVSASTFAQKVNIQTKDASINEVFYKLTQQTGHTFTADASLIKKLKPISLNMRNATLKEVLEKCFSGHDVKMFFNSDDKIVVIKSNNKTEAQSSITITGKVTNEKGEPMEGVSIKVKNTQLGTVSKAAGVYSINVKNENDVLVFSFIGFVAQEVKVGQKRTINIVMNAQNTGLDQVVVIGYGEVKKGDLTGSVGEVKMEEIQKAPVATLDQALAGRVAGLQVSSVDGQPGSESNIVIRGGNSLTQSNSPLYVIDGFPIEDFVLSSLNTEEIESISILKDASATAIYGSRGANGVIIIETKKGKIGRPVINYEGSFGIQQITKKMEMMDPHEFVKFQLELLPSQMTQLYLIQPGMTLDDYKQVQPVDWQSLLFKTAKMHSHNISLRGANNNTKYSLSGSVIDQTGVMVKSGFERAQVRTSLEQTISNKLKANININYTRDKNFGEMASEIQSNSNAFGSYLMFRILGYRPIIEDGFDVYNDVIDPDGVQILVNPLVSANNVIRQSTNSTLLVNSDITYKISNDFTLTVRGGYNFRETKYENFYNSKTYAGFASGFNLLGVNGSSRNLANNTWLNENILTYKKVINKNNSINVVGGITMQGTNLDHYGFTSINIPLEQLGLSALRSGVISSAVSVLSKNTLASFLARVNYTHKSKYFFTASIRQDGSSKFSRANRWGFFPSGAFAWQMGKEDFIRRSSFINDAKLRISYGITGNNRIGDFIRYQTVNTSNFYSFNNATPMPVSIINNMGNQDLKWESTAQLDIGYDMSILKNRIKLTVDAYSKTTDDLLLNANVPLSTGFSTVFKNIGKIRNNGLEIALNTVNVRSKDFKWESAFNISFNRNKILALTEDQDKILSMVNFTGDYNASSLYMAKVGGPAAAIYGYLWNGNYQYEDFNLQGTTYVLKQGVPTNGSPAASIKPGDIKYTDVNGDGVVNEKDMVVIGRGLPIHYGGFTNNFDYKGFSLNIFFQWSYGNDIVNANRAQFEGNVGTWQGINQFASYANRWTPENPTNEHFRVNGFGPRGRYSSKLIEDGSFLRLKTVHLSYSFPKIIIKYVKSLQAYVAAQNLYTWSNYSGYDPEVSVRNTILTPGFDYSSYPRSYTMTMGVKASF